MAFLAVQPTTKSSAVEPVLEFPPRAPEAGERRADARDPRAARDRVTISAAAREKSITTGKELDAAELAAVAELRTTDQRVRTHERAHQAAGGGAAGAASFQYVTGPDGKQYAIGGEVPIRIEGGRTPEEAIAAAQRMRSAALAPADPSAQDLAVAAEAVRMEQNARMQKAREATTVAASPDAKRAAAAYLQFGTRGGAAAGTPGAGPDAAAGSTVAVSA